ncbi:MAG: thioredoxin domain-containing protein [Clostridia bacterium]|nr:thioredoxin domain-containing protein [Clostridia bacterium]
MPARKGTVIVEEQSRTPNRLSKETSPYLLQHADNPVDWYPWGEEAFEKAKREDKPVFLSVGYSTCHWCHVMARESFMDATVARMLNENFVSVKVDREERPDVDSVYMAVCQAFTGRGGWPMSIFMTPEKKPFFAGTYFPKSGRYGMSGFIDLLSAIHEKWQGERDALLSSAEAIVSGLNREAQSPAETDGAALIEEAVALYKQSYDEKYGGFGDAPKFPAPHNLLFLMTYYEKSGDAVALGMAERTLTQMYRGGLFDHIGYGFCRYSTDRFFLVPHFEKMLYDNALLIMAYCKAYALTQKPLYREVAQKTATYVLREMTDAAGGFYSAQDADSEGVEGKYYTFSPEEIIETLGREDGEAFSRCYGITPGGNFEGRSIPTLLPDRSPDPALQKCLPTLYTYRKKRTRLHLDDKVLTSWNSLMIAALCRLYRVSGDGDCLAAAQRAQRFIESALCEGDTLFVSIREGKRGKKAFLDEYACYAFALLALYEATLEAGYLARAAAIAQKTVADFWDAKNGGFYLYGKENEALILRPKETYDGAMPSGNSVMACVLIRLSLLEGDEKWGGLAEAQLAFLSGVARAYPPGYAMFLTALSDTLDPPAKITVVLKAPNDRADAAAKLPKDALVLVLDAPTRQYPLKNDKTTFYLCKAHSCLPPVNDPAEWA